MAKTSSTPPNVALEKIAQLLNNIVDESKFTQRVFLYMAIYDVMWICVYSKTDIQELNVSVNTIIVRKSCSLDYTSLPAP